MTGDHHDEQDYWTPLDWLGRDIEMHREGLAGYVGNARAAFERGDFHEAGYWAACANTLRDMVEAHEELYARAVAGKERLS
jgi:hypothetical protein